MTNPVVYKLKRTESVTDPEAKIFERTESVADSIAYRLCGSYFKESERFIFQLEQCQIYIIPVIQ